jgi:phosphopantothenoylcysteine decarboxylase/phosphopantothenate--cysteine ligase
VALLRLLVERHRFAAIHVALTPSARRFVREEPFAVLARRPCLVDLFDEARAGRPAHVEVAHACDLALVAPASGDVVAKLAHGIADDAVTTVLSVFEGPCVLVPAVHPATSRKPAFARNLAQVEEDGYLLCGPVQGYSISEDRRGANVAAMPDAEAIAAFVEHVVLTGRAPDVHFAYPTG